MSVTTTASTTTPKDLFQSWLEARRLPLLCNFTPTASAPVLTIEIGKIDDRPVYAYGALGSQYSALWWERWSLSWDEAFDSAWPYLPEHVRKQYLRTDDLRAFLTRILPTCPLCQRSYERSDNKLQELQIYGHMKIICGCGRGGSDPSDLLKEVRALRDSRRSSVTSPVLSYELVEAKIGEAVVARLSVSPSSEGVTLSLVRENFHSARGAWSAAYVWPRTMLTIIARQEDECRRKAYREELLELRLQWDPLPNTWIGHTSSSALLMYFVPGTHAVEAEGWYYCQPVPKKEGDKTWMVRVEPVCRVPDRHLERSSRRPSRPVTF